VRYGASPRAAQAIIVGSKIHAILAGRVNVAFDDVRLPFPEELPGERLEAAVTPLEVAGYQAP